MTPEDQAVPELKRVDWFLRVSTFPRAIMLIAIGVISRYYEWWTEKPALPLGVLFFIGSVVNLMTSRGPRPPGPNVPQTPLHLPTGSLRADRALPVPKP